MASRRGAAGVLVLGFLTVAVGGAVLPAEESIEGVGQEALASAATPSPTPSAVPTPTVTVTVTATPTASSTPSATPTAEPAPTTVDLAVSASATTVTSGRRVELSVSTSPRTAGVPVVLQVRRGVSWQSVGRASTGARGRAAFEVTAERTARYRVVASGTQSTRRATSDVTAITVNEPEPPPAVIVEPEPDSGSAYFDNCDDARAAGAAPVHRGDPGYGSHLDRDDDGVGCES
ncbi:excalibur calcium-binding domain-containing protein [Motilibacter sp. E257]|uniref:Excalibur calcium-binding domain-containing protein n=2 Tax=Motilibacter deserti TaxID=2714956 RepID=A0ABX0GX32_9ACTN|nr:excalibur calcium-binding domain-containing protein [Motilibacter deserti]